MAQFSWMELRQAPAIIPTSLDRKVTQPAGAGQSRAFARAREPIVQHRKSPNASPSLERLIAAARHQVHQPLRDDPGQATHIETPASVDDLLGRFEQFGLFDDRQLADIRRSTEDTQSSASNCLDRLVDEGKLTRWQAQRVLDRQECAIPLVLGEYVLLDKIGQGGMGVVYKAHHKRLRNQVALKVLPPGAKHREGALQRFHREIATAGQLSHPNVVSAFYAGTAAGVEYLVMEYVAGSDLTALVRGGGTLAVGEALECILQAARGLEYAHSREIVHRDVKPSNLLLDESGTLKVLDLGLARWLLAVADDSTPDNTDLTATDAVMGTVDYMAPEQAENPRSTDHRADIYSLGCTLYFLLTGRPPYRGDSSTATLIAHREQPIPDLPEQFAGESRLIDMFRRMLAKKPCDRHQSMRDVITDVEAILPRVAASQSLAVTSAHIVTPAETVDAIQKPTTVAKRSNGSDSGLLLSETVATSSDAELDLPIVTEPAPQRRGLLIGLSLALILAVTVTAVLIFNGNNPFGGSDNPRDTISVDDHSTSTGSHASERHQSPDRQVTLSAPPQTDAVVEFLMNEPLTQILIDDKLPKQVEIKNDGRRQLVRVSPGNHRFTVTSGDGQRTVDGLFSANRSDSNFKAVELKSRRPIPSRFNDRTAAEFILRIGGKVEVIVGTVDAKYVTVTETEKLPTGPFKLWTIEANDSRMNDLVFKALAESRLEYLSGLQISGSSVSDAGLAEGSRLMAHQLDLGGTRVTDRGLAFLKSYRATGYLILSGRKITNRGLKEFADKKLAILYLFGTAVTDLAPLKGREFLELSVSGSPIVDLSPIRQIRIKRRLDISDTAITDLSPLRGLTIPQLELQSTKVTDMTPLTAIKSLAAINLDYKPEYQSLLKSISSLKRINGRPKENFFAEAAKRK